MYYTVDFPLVKGSKANMTQPWYNRVKVSDATSRFPLFSIRSH